MIRKRLKTQDFDTGPPPGAVPLSAVTQIGPKRELMKNGNLICRDVPIARVGTMLYHGSELPLPTNDKGFIHVERSAEDLFTADTIASINGAALTDGHPATDVTPKNWDHLACGFVINAHRGSGDDADVILADLVVTRKGTIDAILAGLREVSLGYDADYAVVLPGVARQSGLEVNHLALVEKGRCGPRCAIGDHQPTIEPLKGARMSKKRVTLDESAITALQALGIKTGDDAETVEDDNHVHIHINNGAPASEAKTPTVDAAVEERFVKLETGMSEVKTLLEGIAKSVGTADAKKKKVVDGQEVDEDEDDDAGTGGMVSDTKKGLATGDSAALASGYQTLASQCEILVPGFKVPTFDAKLKRADTVDSMCQTRGRVLDIVAADPAGQILLKTVSGEDDLDLAKLDCKAKAVLFNAAAGAKSFANNTAATRDSGRLPGAPKLVPVVSALGGRSPVKTAEEVNKANAEYWKGR